MKSRLAARVSTLDRSWLIPVGAILFASVLAYLPGLLQATVYRDDWYYIMDRLIGGPGVFQGMFSIDRPARGPFFELYYQLFGITPLPYHLASYIWRFLAGLAALWLFRLLWPDQRRATLWMALLFVLFPGYLRWMEGMEDQPRIASLCLEGLSIALTLKAIGAARPLPRIAAWVGSILTGWAYLALVDFGTGMEVFRLLCVFVVVDGQMPGEPILKRALSTLRAWALAALIPAGFLFWRLFIFHNQRPQTDIGRQVGVFLASPLTTAATWLVRLVQSAADVLIFSWVTPVLQGYFGLRLKEILPGAILVSLAVGAFYLANRLLRSEALESEQDSGALWSQQAVAIGLLGVVAGVLPVIVANRYVDFERYSHYALPASLSAAVFLVGLLYSFRSHRASLHIGAALVACAVAAHYVYSTQIVQEERTISAFWHQVAWRAPMISPQTTLFVNYPNVDYEENVDAVQGPANFIYYPGPTGQIPVTYPLFALPKTDQTVTQVLVGKDATAGYRTHRGTIDFARLLVLSQPSPDSCVHLINGQSPLFSASDPSDIRVVGASSQIAVVTEGPDAPKLSALMFGPEPSHGWCYYFEKADLARQFADWKQIAALGREVDGLGLHPNDGVEWTPLLQAYAYLGDVPRFNQTARRLAADPFARVQACSILKQMRQSSFSFSPEIDAQVSNLLCIGE